jgi:hypothetical protein
VNQTQRRYASRLQELIDEGKEIENLVKKRDTPRNPGFIVMVPSFPDVEDEAVLNAWLTKVENIVEIIFGSTSTQFRRLEELTNKGITFGKSRIESIRGLLIGSLDDLNNGFLIGQEFLIASEILDSVIEEAKELLNVGYKDPAAVLGRVVMEDSLKRLARQEGIDDTLKASKINDELKKIGIYNLPQSRLIQACLDIGNYAAHGQFEEYSKEDVRNQIDDIERFLASNFKF